VSLSSTCLRRRDGQACGALATVLPAIDLYADRTLHPTAPPATMLIGMPHCDACAAMTTINDLTDDRTWADIRASFSAIRRAEPKRSDAVLRWHAVDGEIVRAWQTSVEATRARIAQEQRHRDN
jgi:hypothetical protein